MSGSHFENFSQAFNEAMLLLDSRGQVLAVNRHAERLFACPAASLLQQPIQGHLAMERARLQSLLHDWANSRTFSQHELELKNGQVCRASAAVYEDVDQGRCILLRCSLETDSRNLNSERIQSLESALKELAVGTAVVKSEDYFASLVSYLAGAAAVKCAFITECGNDDNKLATTLAFWKFDRLAENFSYAIKGSPCENLMEGESCYFPDNLQEVFPDNPDFPAMGVNCYYGVPLRDGDNVILGHLVLLNDAPLKQADFVIPLMETFAARSAAEIIRMRTERLKANLLSELERQVAERTHSLQGLNLELRRQIRARNKAMDEMFVAKDAAERASHAKSDFLSRMSHELRTPMNAIMGFSQLLEVNKKAELDDESHAYVREIMQASGHMLKLIEEVLSLSEMESGELSLSIQEVDVVSLVGDSLYQTDELRQKRGIQVETIFPDTPLTLHADADQLSKVLNHLISNALKYARKQVRIRIEKRQQMVYVEVSDDGRGIAKDVQQKLFEPFIHSAERVEDNEGAGIGLAVCRRLLHYMGGEIHYHTELNQGSLFWFELPLVDNAQQVCTESA